MAKPPSSILEISLPNFTWVSVNKPTKNNLNYLLEEYDFLPLDIDACPPPLQNPRVHVRDDYVFMILQFPVYDKKTRQVHSSEVDFFITKDRIVTIHNNDITPIKDLIKVLSQANKDPLRKKRYEHYDIETFLFKLVTKLYLYCFPILNHFNEDLETLEENIFCKENCAIHEDDLIYEILNIRRNIVNFRKSLQAHKNMWKRFAQTAMPFFEQRKDLEKYNRILIEHTKDIWEVVENHKDTINALYDTHESMIGARLNGIMKALTIASVIFLPLTLISSVFGMNIDHFPLTNSPLDFWLILGIMLVLSIGLIWFFRKVRWL